MVRTLGDIMKDRDVIKDIIDIKVAVGKIEEHLNSMKEKSITHENFIKTDCPVKMKDVYKKLDNTFYKLFITNIGIWTSVIILLVSLILNK